MTDSSISSGAEMLRGIFVSRDLIFFLQKQRFALYIAALS